MLAPNTVTRAALDVARLGNTGCRIVDAHIEKMHAPIVLPIIPADVGQRATGFDHHSHSVELCMPRVKDVTGHELDRSAAESVERRGEIGGNGLR